MALLRLLICACALATATAVVVGIDLGSSFMKVALVKPGAPFSIVTNVHSKRKTEVMVGFNEGERLFGANAANLLTRKPQFTYSELRRVIGRRMDHPAVLQLQKEYYPSELVTNETSGGIAITHHKGKEDETNYKTEELMAMVLQHAKDITKAYGDVKQVRDAVITVPAFFTETERAAVIDAATIAGLKVLGLIDENTAAALQYGIDRKFENGTHNVLYYNLGANSLQVSVVSYSVYKAKQMGKNVTVGTFAVKGKAWDESIGGNHFDNVLVEAFASSFNEQWRKKVKDDSKDVRKIQRPMSKLRKQATKTKTVLSANEEIPVFVQSLYDDLDFAFGKITRKDFEEKSAHLFELVTPAIDRALKMAKLEKADIDAVELLGGGVRIPRVKKSLEEYFGDDVELGVHLNGDEAMALGAAFYGANLSTAFRVRKVGMQDISPFAVGVRLREIETPDDDEDGNATDAEAAQLPEETEKDKKPWTKRATIFRPKNKLNSRKIVTFSHSKDVSATFQYDKNKAQPLPDGTYPTISSFNVTGVKQFAKEMAAKNISKTKIHISFWLDNSGLVHIAKAEATADYFVEAPKPKPKLKPVANVTLDPNATDANATDANATDADADDTDEKDNKEGKQDEEEKEDSSEASTANATDAQNSTDVDDDKPKMIKKTHRRVLTVTRTDVGVKVLPMSGEQKEESMEMLKELDRQDEIRMLREEARNTLESFLYSSKDKLNTAEEDVAKVTSEQQRTDVFASFESTEEWLYDEGENLEAEKYHERLAEIKAVVDGIFFRSREFKARPKQVKIARAFLNKTLNGTLPKWQKSKPQITETERTEVFNASTEIVEWLNEKEEAQAKLDVTEKPAFRAYAVKTRLQPLRAMITRFARRPSALVKAEPRVENATSVNATGTNTTGADVDADVLEETGTSEDDAQAQDGKAADADEDTQGSGSSAQDGDSDENEATKEGDQLSEEDKDEL